MTDIKPTFATNHDGEIVADALNSHLEYLLGKWADPFQVDIASAYFNPGGFGLLADALERIGSVRLLLGAQPTTAPARPRRLRGDTESAEQARLRRALLGHGRDLDLDRDLLGFTAEEDRAVRRLIDWLESGLVEVKRFEEGFLHGKAFLVSTDREGVIAGSSNFTYAGLAKNHELNLGHYDPLTVERVAGWFEGLW